MSARHPLTGWRVAGLTSLALLATFSHSLAADLATPTATVAAFTPAATASPQPAQRAQEQLPIEGKRRFVGAITAEQGLQVGREGDGATKLTFAKRVKCTVDLGTISAPVRPTPEPTPVSITSFGVVPTVTKVTCPATGAAVGDFAMGRLNAFDTGTTNYEALRVDRCAVVVANELTCWLKYSGSASLDPAVVTIDALVVR